jgi:hypothetical protein
MLARALFAGSGLGWHRSGYGRAALRVNCPVAEFLAAGWLDPSLAWRDNSKAVSIDRIDMTNLLEIKDPLLLFFSV